MEHEELKVVIINRYDEDALLEDGNIYRKSGGKDFFHGDLLIEYGLKTYGEDSIFSILANGKYSPDVPAYFLVEEKGNIVFLNVSTKRCGKMGLLFMPDDLSFEQDESLNTFLQSVKDFSITVNSNMRVEDGIVCYDSGAYSHDNVNFKVKKKA